MTALIVRKIDFEDKSFLIKYSFSTGEFAFYTQGDSFEDYSTPIDSNPFKVMNLMKRALEGVDMPKISFQATGLTQRDVMIKDALYRRALDQLDYNYMGEFPAGATSDFKKESISGTWKGPYRFYQRRN